MRRARTSGIVASEVNASSAASAAFRSGRDVAAVVMVSPLVDVGPKIYVASL
jgi:hypothetical protein